MKQITLADLKLEAKKAFIFSYIKSAYTFPIKFLNNEFEKYWIKRLKKII